MMRSTQGATHSGCSRRNEIIWEWTRRGQAEGLSSVFSALLSALCPDEDIIYRVFALNNSGSRTVSICRNVCAFLTNSSGWGQFYITFAKDLANNILLICLLTSEKPTTKLTKSEENMPERRCQAAVLKTPTIFV